MASKPIREAASVLRRTLFYVPASSPRMLAKSHGIRSDNITYDLEDSVTPNAKSDALHLLRHELETLASGGVAAPKDPLGRRAEIAVRINAVTTTRGLADLADMGVLAMSAVDAIVVPKVNCREDLELVSDAVMELQDQQAQDQLQPIKLIAMIESGRGVAELPSMLRYVHNEARQERTPLDGVVFAAEDYALDLSLERTPSLKEFLFARSAIVNHARAAGISSVIDLVCTSFRGQDGLTQLANECRDGRGLGFTGKQIIHPAQLSVAQQVFSGIFDDADRARLAWAVRIERVAQKEADAGRGAFTLDGAMIDAPVIGKASSILKRAELGGARAYIDELRDTYTDAQAD